MCSTLLPEDIDTVFERFKRKFHQYAKSSCKGVDSGKPKQRARAKAVEGRKRGRPALPKRSESKLAGAMTPRDFPVQPSGLPLPFPSNTPYGPFNPTLNAFMSAQYPNLAQNFPHQSPFASYPFQYATPSTEGGPSSSSSYAASEFGDTVPNDHLLQKTPGPQYTPSTPISSSTIPKASELVINTSDTPTTASDAAPAASQDTKPTLIHTPAINYGPSGLPYPFFTDVAGAAVFSSGLSTYDTTEYGLGILKWS
ncbi:hypothetical protein K402DRAFT_399510 [Aulographum hederae CBS 113979]|uniref:Uncharacterized protein n=1 Tax=Aulographum hederae CBS 113979 TaxID=1176131 RepID=A0A6G1HH36_9PEZI|nr:hypothetical protein K402DRAFT_399510 [Aulographum hederae CBS 113979]